MTKEEVRRLFNAGAFWESGTTDQCFEDLWNQIEKNKTDNDEELAIAGAVMQWVAVSERLPELGQKVLVVQDPKTTATRKPLFAWFDGKDFRPPEPTVYFANCELGTSKWSDIIYWMELPEPPCA